MGKKTEHDNFRVVLGVPHPGYFSDDAIREKAERRAADELAAQAKRHLDAASISVESDANDVCEWCGGTWTEGNSPHNGGCCDKDLEVMDKTEEANHATNP